jgi:hypothetical protein
MLYFFNLLLFHSHLIFLTSMQHTNAPRIFVTASGNVFVDTEIIDSQRRQRQIPIVDVRVTILPGLYYLNLLLKKRMLLQLILWVCHQNPKQILYV